MRIFLLTLALSASAAFGHGLESRVVDTEEGPVKGYKDPDGGLYAFYNIPYAKAPTVKQRFKAPLPAERRHGVFEARDKGIVCPQKLSYMTQFKFGGLIATEDCLMANIFVPETDKINIPVIVYVHGGGYILGYGNIVTYKQLAKSKEIIVVTFNYHLGPHGFLCLGTEDIPGNAGMKDQVALLRWVQSNIKNFAGNPDDVTLAGGSAGSASVDLLMLSKTTKGLFSKIIAESGSALAAMSVQTDPIAVAKKYARSLNYTNVNDFYGLEKFYKTISYEILLEGVVMAPTDSTFIFSPCVERDTQEEEFLTESPVNILRNGNYVKLPTLCGFADMEGLIRVNLFEEWKHKMNENFMDFLPPDLQFTNDEERDGLLNKIRKFYFGDDLTVTNEKILNYIDFFSDLFFTYSTLRSVKLRTSVGDVNNIYLYEFTYVPDETPIPYTEKRGANHGAQTFLVADGYFPNFDESNLPQEVKEMKKLLRELWFNFILTGKPVPEGSHLPIWPPASEGWTPHMTIDKTLKLGESLLKERVQFWDEIYNKHYRHPSPPPTPPTQRIEL